MSDETEIDTDDLERRMKGAMESLRSSFARGGLSRNSSSWK